MIKSAVAQVRGMVQGVGFRYSAVNRARSLALSGWVRNEMDGSVTVRFQGEEEDFDAYIEWLRKGPPSARVTDLQVTELNPEGDLGPFSVSF